MLFGEISVFAGFFSVVRAHSYRDRPFSSCSSHSYSSGSFFRRLASPHAGHRFSSLSPLFQSVSVFSSLSPFSQFVFVFSVLLCFFSSSSVQLQVGSVSH